MKLLFIFLFAFYAFAEEKNALADSVSLFETPSDKTKVVSKEDESVLDEFEKDAVMEFFVQEVIPAFGGFQDILFSKPSFEIHWTPQGMQIKHCSFKFQLKQVRTVSYNVADVQLYGFQSNAEIGGPGLLFVELSCGGVVPAEDVLHFKVKIFATDEEQKSSYYSFKITTMDKEQLDFQLKSIELDVSVENADNSDGIFVSDPDEDVENLPQDSPFLKFFEEEKAYAEIVSEDAGDSLVNGEDKPKNMYDVPLNIWNQIKGGDAQDGSSGDSSESGSLIALTKLSVNQIINVKGSVEILVPVYTSGVKTHVPAVVPIIGRFVSSVDGDFIPIMFNVRLEE